MAKEMTKMLTSGTPPDIVDSTLLAIAADPLSREVVLTFRTSARRFSARATGVDELLVQAFLRQNVVDEVRTWDHDSDAGKLGDLLAALLFDRESAAEVTEPGLVARLEDSVDAILGGGRVLLEVTPALGASVLLLAASVEWSDSSVPDL